MNPFLLSPHSTTRVSLAESMFRRKLRTLILDRDKEAKERGKLYGDEKRGARESDVKEGDRVLLKQKQTNNLTPSFRPEPFRGLEKTGNSVVF